MRDRVEEHKPVWNVRDNLNDVVDAWILGEHDREPDVIAASSCNRHDGVELSANCDQLTEGRRNHHARLVIVTDVRGYSDSLEPVVIRVAAAHEIADDTAVAKKRVGDDAVRWRRPAKIEAVAAEPADNCGREVGTRPLHEEAVVAFSPVD